MSDLERARALAIATRQFGATAETASIAFHRIAIVAERVDPLGDFAARAESAIRVRNPIAYWMFYRWWFWGFRRSLLARYRDLANGEE